MVRLIYAPFDLCGRAVGSRLGPLAVELSGLHETLRSLGVDVEGPLQACALDGEVHHTTTQRDAAAGSTYMKLRYLVASALEHGTPSIVIGGDHSLAMGSISGALQVLGSRLAVVWIDAHMDLNTPDSSPSGNIHGMPLAALCRMPASPASPLHRTWTDWQEHLVPGQGLSGNRLAWIGLRDVDQGERQNLATLHAPFVATMEMIDRVGIGQVMERFFFWLAANGATHLWVSFDVDSLDPLLAPGTGTTVRGGLSYREGHFIAEALSDRLLSSGLELAGVDVVEVNPLQDTRNETARQATDWLASLLGKRIL